MWHSVCEVGRGLLRFKTKAWFQVIVNTIVKVTFVSFVCVTTVHATDYGSLQLSTILSKPDAEIVSDTAVISVSGSQMPLLDSVSASDDQAPGNVVIVCFPALIRSGSSSPSKGNGPIPNNPFSD